MATIQHLSQQGEIHKLDPELEDDEQELRCIYASDAVMQFLTNDLPSLQSFFGTETNPAQDLDALVAEFASGLPIEFDTQVKAFRRKCFHVMEGGVWYLKTPDLRIFGWFPHQDCFVAVFADTFENVKGKDLYEGRRNQVIQFRNALNLDAPKFIPGDNPHAVVSNCTISN